MKFSGITAALAALSGISALPSHMHKHAQRSANAQPQFVKSVRPAPVVEEAPVDYSPPAPTVTKAPSPAPSQKVKTPESKGSGQGPSTYTPFCGGNTKRASMEDIMYAGNIGAPGNYGCNMMLVQSNIVQKYDYKVKIVNEAANEQQCIGYLKVGKDGGINGFFKGNEALKFTLPAGATQWMVLDENTQGGVICQEGELESTKIGEWASTWAEFDAGNKKNNGWSGADASCLTASRAGKKIPGMEISGHNTYSRIWPGGKGENAFTVGMEAEDGWGLNVPPGGLEMTVKVGWSGN